MIECKAFDGIVRDVEVRYIAPNKHIRYAAENAISRRS